MTQTILYEVRDRLRELGVVRNEQEFCVAWLGRGSGYIRTLRFIDQPPSAEALAILANKLEYYAGEISRSGQRAEMAQVFQSLAARTRAALDELARARWAEAGRMNHGS